MVPLPPPIGSVLKTLSSLRGQKSENHLRGILKSKNNNSHQKNCQIGKPLKPTSPTPKGLIFLPPHSNQAESLPFELNVSWVRGITTNNNHRSHLTMTPSCKFSFSLSPPSQSGCVSALRQPWL